MISVADPLVDAPPKEVPLKNAPLVRVIAQVRFPEVLSVEQRDFVAPFQRAVQGSFPVLRHEQIQSITLGASDLAPFRLQTTWRFGTVAGDWRLSLAPDFLALETTKYTSRADFFAHLRVALEALDAHVGPKLVDRLGVRYIDRITGVAVDEIASLVRPEVRGVIGTPAASHAAHSISETMFRVGDARIMARWGQLQAGTTVDPAAIETIQDKSWILDLDMFSAAAAPFAVDDVIATGQSFAERLYTVFRWAVTDDFLRRFGGDP